MDFEITKREILVTIAITLILIGFGFLISSAIRNGIYEANEKYYKALKINNDEDTFRYAVKTNIGNVLVFGKVRAVDGVSIPDIEGNYYYIRKEKEKYTRHTRQVEHTRTVSDGHGGYKTETYYTTEEYYTWDYQSKEEFHTEKFNFSGVEYPYGKLNFHNEYHKDTIKESSKIRYKYYVIPSEFNITLFTHIENNDIMNNEVYINIALEDVISSKQGQGTAAIVGFWILWVLFIALLDFGYMYLENNYLED